MGHRFWVPLQAYSATLPEDICTTENGRMRDESTQNAKRNTKIRQMTA